MFTSEKYNVNHSLVSFVGIILPERVGSQKKSGGEVCVLLMISRLDFVIWMIWREIG